MSPLLLVIGHSLSRIQARFDPKGSGLSLQFAATIGCGVPEPCV